MAQLIALSLNNAHNLLPRPPSAKSNPLSHFPIISFTCPGACHSAQWPVGTSALLNFGITLSIPALMAGMRISSLRAWTKSTGCERWFLVAEGRDNSSS